MGVIAARANSITGKMAPTPNRGAGGGTMVHRMLLAAAISLGAFSPAHAQDYPARPIRMVVPYPAGGTADLMPRIFADKLAAKWGQPVLVEDRPGAGGNIAAELVYKAEPDGYTLLASPPGPLIINQNLYPSLAFDPAQFVPVAIMGAVPNVLLVTPSLGATTVPELIAYARTHPGKLNYASQGSGTTSHLTAELFKSMAGGLAITHIPYKGSAPALADLLSGQVDLMFDNLGVSLQHVKSGKLRALAAGSDKRIASLPDVPAMTEILPGFSSVTWFGIVAPPKTAPPVAEKLSAAIAEAIAMPEVRERLAKLSAEPVGGTPAQMAAFMKQDAGRWRDVIRAAGVKTE
jgi:tripartite-type tricarboxylate transporter receptor subunit TctC